LTAGLYKINLSRRWWFNIDSILIFTKKRWIDGRENGEDILELLSLRGINRRFEKSWRKLKFILWGWKSNYVLCRIS